MKILRERERNARDREGIGEIVLTETEVMRGRKRSILLHLVFSSNSYKARPVHRHIFQTSLL